jgi:uncharacterized membrane protein
MKMHEIDEGFVDSVKHGFKKYNDRDAVISPFKAGWKDAGEKDKDKKDQKKKTETTAGDVASSMGGGNGFVGGGVGTIKRAPGSKKKKKAVKR